MNEVKEEKKLKKEVKKCETTCLYCNRVTEPVWVHGHFQCPLCKTVVESCCEGGEVND
jgi:hypothetical protein